MASNKKKTDIPAAFIDYEGQEGIDWTGSDLIEYWTRALMRAYRTNGRLWTVKERTAAARLVKEFPCEELKRMVDHWMKNPAKSSPENFTYFYQLRYQMSRESAPKDYDWD